MVEWKVGLSENLLAQVPDTARPSIRRNLLGRHSPVEAGLSDGGDTNDAKLERILHPY